VSARIEQLREQGGTFAVADIARFAITGADRLRYLNGQVSNDLRKLAPGRAMEACVLSAKGKLDAVVWIWSEAERFVVECDAALAEPLAMRLERYIVADDVTIEPLPLTPRFHVFGPAAEGFEGLQISRLGASGVDVSEPPANVPAATPNEIERLRIEQRVPRWGAELGRDTLPAEAGLDATAVDFHKGCYIGQEVVSRIRSVGHANRALRTFDVLSGEPPVPGAEFFAAEDPMRAAATVTSIYFALSPAIGLCYIRRGTAEGTVLEAPASASRIQLRPCVTPS
jgi:folate-binding protein YgfZ